MSQSQKALSAMLKEGLTLREAANRFGISAQAIWKAKHHPSKKIRIESEIAELRAELAAAKKQRDELEFSWAGCSQQLKDACEDLDAVEKERDELRAKILELQAAIAAKDAALEEIARYPRSRNEEKSYATTRKIAMKELSVKPADAELRKLVAKHVRVSSTKSGAEAGRYASQIEQMEVEL